MKTRIKQSLKKIANFLGEVKTEIKKIDWLSAKETLQLTMVVIFVSVIVAIFLGGIDFLLTTLLNKFVF